MEHRSILPRDYPNEFIQTGISAIDGLKYFAWAEVADFLGLGRRIPVGYQIARQAQVLNRRKISP